MENNLYYTPTIEEFHVGFIYEREEYDDLRMIDEWYETSIDTPWQLVDYVMYLQNFNFNKTRVKYLDQSDIESLGWESDQYVPERNICLNFKKPNDWYLNYWFGQIPYIEISRDGYDTGCALNVKNKSELIKLMQQLNIK